MIKRSLVFLSLLVFESIYSSGIIDGSEFANLNNVRKNWTILADNPKGRGIYITFLESNLEPYPPNDQFPSVCSDIVSIITPSKIVTGFCGYQNIQKKLSVYKTNVPLTQVNLNTVFYFNESSLVVRFSSDTGNPSTFKLWYYSGM
jgi:hypothetical protein